ncbi:hypothetical protein N8I77_013305 [Diaporthe amygdali]|uniref:Uncharacterized protein n=1 Tax=Phomopsis amygdali TaxID=1214568 RepID=A0AAD9S168_PHOAM|nr:hypothetical protein N8I77_013305 [Diaporthe amygdali]
MDIVICDDEEYSEHLPTIESPTATSQSSEKDAKKDATGPMRVLVQTRTHLVPGDGHSKKVLSMLHRICLHQWGRNFNPYEDRSNTYGDEFGYNDRLCFFLVDHGESPTGSDDPAEVPMTVYEWDGKSLQPFPGPLPNEVQERLKKYRFKPKVTKESMLPRHEDLPPEERRRSIKRMLRRETHPPESDLQFLRDHPQHAEWLKVNLRPRFWDKLQNMMKERDHRDVLHEQSSRDLDSPSADGNDGNISND